MATPERFLLARRWRGLTQAQLAAAAGCSKSQIEKIEGGHTSPSPALLESISKELAFPLEFFSAPPPVEVPPETVSFRAATKMTARERDAALAVGALASQLSSWLDQNFELPAPSIPDLAGLSPEAAAENLRAAWSLSDRPISNMIHLLELHGVRVFSLARETRDVDAYSFWSGARPFVFLNTVKSAERSRFDAAHELGHLVLHRQRANEGRTLEDEANAFASAFLLPSLPVLARAGPSPDLLRGKRYWGVSLFAYLYRLHALGRITQWHYKHLCIEHSRKGARTTEPQPIPRETSQVMQKVLQHLRSQGGGKAALCRQLAINGRDLDEMLFGLVVAVVG